MFFFQFLLILLCILVGARIGGVALGTFSGLGLVILAFVFGVMPTSPPIDVLLMIFAVITAVSVMQAAGGLDYLVSLAERALKKDPSKITFVAPIVAYIFTFLAGTGHVVYAILPVIAEISKKAGVRPERPMSISVIASQQAITACPISAATVSLLAFLADQDITLFHILAVCVPSTLVGVLVAALVVNKLGLELDKDPIYLQKLREGTLKKNERVKPKEAISVTKGKLSVLFFLLGTLAIVLLGSRPELRPSWLIDGINTPMKMPITIEIIMLGVGALILCLKVDKNKVINSEVAKAGFVAIVSIFGIAWLGDTFVASNSELIHSTIGDVVNAYPFLFALALFVLSIFLYSQAATTLALMPLGLALKIPAPFLIAMFPAVNGYFFLPTYGTMLAAIAFDTTPVPPKLANTY